MPGISFLELLTGVELVQRGHVDIEQDYVRPGLLRQLQQFPPIRRDPKNLSAPIVS